MDPFHLPVPAQHLATPQFGPLARVFLLCFLPISPLCGLPTPRGRFSLLIDWLFLLIITKLLPFPQPSGLIGAIQKHSARQFLASPPLGTGADFTFKDVREFFSHSLPLPRTSQQPHPTHRPLSPFLLAPPPFRCESQFKSTFACRQFPSHSSPLSPHFLHDPVPPISPLLDQFFVSASEWISLFPYASSIP